MCVAALSGCIGAAGIPGGPLQGTGVQLGGSWGYAFAPSRITMRSQSDGRSDSYVDNAADALNFPVLPSRLGGRVGIGKWFDVAGDLSWLDSGLELRAGLPEGSRPFPMALSLGLRSGRWGMLDFDNRDSSEQRLRLEAYPRLATYPASRLNLISTLGISTGRRFHPSQLPGRFAGGRFDDPGPNVDPRLLRDETRLEGSIGCEVRQKGFFASALFMPYVVTGSGNLTASCGSCEGWETERFRSSFGGALFLTLGISFLFDGSD